MEPPAYIIEETLTQFIVACPYCDKNHCHGKEEGSRSRHCYLTKKNKRLIEARTKYYNSTTYDVKFRDILPAETLGIN